MNFALAAILFASIGAQAPTGSVGPFGASGCPFTDSFAGSGALSGSYSGITATGITTAGASIQRNSGVAQASASFKQAGAIVTGGTCSFPEDQSAQVTISANATVGDMVGLFVLMTTTGNGYGYSCSSAGACKINRYATGTPTLLLSCTGTGTAGAVIKITVTGAGAGQTLNCFINGTAGGTVVDSTWTTGNPGLWINNGNGAAATATQASTFSAD